MGAILKIESDVSSSRTGADSNLAAGGGLRGVLFAEPGAGRVMIL
ncbi:hypothetical protein [Glutamicibacter nicotianae]|nr:hypothetical protein [Glutamicibacter nicotianae]